MLRTKLTDLAVDIQGDAIGMLLNGGYCDAYDGAQPEAGGEALDGQVLCFSLGFGNPAFLPCKAGMLQANPMTAGVVVSDLPNGIPRSATWFRTYLADHRTPVFDGSIGTKNANMILKESTLMVPGTAISVRSFTHIIPKALPGT